MIMFQVILRGHAMDTRKTIKFKQGNPITRSQLALMIQGIQKGTDYEYLYFKDFNIHNKTKIHLDKSVTDEVTIEDPSVITLVDVSNNVKQGNLHGAFVDE